MIFNKTMCIATISYFGGVSGNWVLFLSRQVVAGQSGPDGGRLVHRDLILPWVARLILNQMETSRNDAWKVFTTAAIACTATTTQENTCRFFL